MKTVIISCLDIYKKISHFPAMVYHLLILQPQCKFYPTCSVYAKKAVIKYGLGWGLCLAVFRIIRCNPLSKGGVNEP